MLPCPFETFPALSSLRVIHAFSGRIPGLDVQIERQKALQKLSGYHAELRSRIGAGGHDYVTAEQIHGAGVAVVRDPARDPIPGVDALITDNPNVCLGIYVADCCPVWLVDPERRAIACIHSGRKGTDLGVVPATIRAMVETFGCDPSKMTAQLGPCVRPPHYEVDFAAAIVGQCRMAGIGSIFDSGTCTASDSARYYSYRREHGRTGRMVALLALA